MSFHPQTVDAFVFEGWDYDRGAARVDLHYRLEPGRSFRETVSFPDAARAPETATLDRPLRLLHLLAGISYYKAACPPSIRVEYPVGPALATFVQDVYRNGLGEFAWRNELMIHDRIVIPGEGRDVGPDPASLAPGVVVPIGGGKDSLVSVDLLQRAGIDFRTIAVGDAALIAEVAGAVDAGHIRIQRKIDPRLLELNRQGALNGHVPISAILAAIMYCGAHFHGYDTVVMSNERSAEQENLVMPDGFLVNHQYSKTLAFERDFQRRVEGDTADGFRYFSLLRPWSELAIARHFATLEKYHGVFSSCNRNFRLSGANGGRWCRDCPKCRFVFLALAPFMSRDAVTGIFGGNLLDAEDQLPGYRALLGLDAVKPFECVGETRECRAALCALGAQPEWQDCRVVRALVDEFEPEPLAPWLEPGDDHDIPTQFREIAGALGRA